VPLLSHGSVPDRHARPRRRHRWARRLGGHRDRALPALPCFVIPRGGTGQRGSGAHAPIGRLTGRALRHRFLTYTFLPCLPDPYRPIVPVRPVVVGGASRLPRRLPDQAAPSFTAPLRRHGRRGLAPPPGRVAPRGALHAGREMTAATTATATTASAVVILMSRSVTGSAPRASCVRAVPRGRNHPPVKLGGHEVVVDSSCHAGPHLRQ
jgi:hypothetical protein